MKRVPIVATSSASLFKTRGFPIEANVRTVESDFRVRQMSGRIFDALIATALLAVLALACSAANAQSSLTGENAKEMERFLAVREGIVVVPCSSTKPPRTPAGTLDRFLMWNEIALDTTAIDQPPDQANPSCFGEQLGPPRMARALAIVHIAMFDALNAITKEFVSYTGIPYVSGDVSIDRAIAQAAHDTLVALYPFQADRIDALFAKDIATIPGSQASIAAGAALGQLAATAILARRLNDGSQLPEPTVKVTCSPGDVTCIPLNTAPGLWETDPIGGLKIALGGNWGKDGTARMMKMLTP